MDTTAASAVVATPPPQPQPIGWDAQGNPITQESQQSLQQPQGWDANGTPIPAADPKAAEGLYAMKDPKGNPVMKRYSEVGPALDQGHLFADKQTLRTYAQDHAADPLSESRVDQWLDRHPYLGAPLNMIEGAGTGALKTWTGFDKTPTSRLETNLQMAAATPTKGFAQGVGDLAESAGEFLSGEELLGFLGKAAEGVGVADKLKSVTGLAQLVQKFPMIGKLLKVGSSAVKQGTVAGAQTLAKTGGDTDAAATAALTAGAIGGVAGGVSEGLQGAIARRATTMEDVGGVQTPVPAAVRNSATPTPAQASGQESIGNAARDALRGHLEEVNESRATPAGPKQLPARTGPFEFNLRGVTPTETTTGTIAPRAAEIPRENTSVPANRTPATTEYSRVGTEPEYIRPGGGDAIAQREGRVWAERRIPGHMHSAAPGETPAETTLGGGGNLTTQDANIAKAHIKNLNDVIESPDFEKMPPAQQQDLMAARGEAQKQMADYHEHVMSNLPGATRPNMEPIDIPAVLRKTGNWRDAANELEKTGSHGYDLLNDVTGGKFNALRQENKDAWNAWTGASGEANQRVAKAALDQSEAKMAQMFKGLRGIVNEKELDGFNDAYRNAQGLHRVADAVESTFRGNANPSVRSWEYRGFDGNQLMSNMTKLQQTMGRGALNRLIGEGNANTLFRVAELNSTLEQRGRFGAAITAIAKHLPVGHLSAAGVGSIVGWRATHDWKGAAIGAVAGGALGAASSRVINSMLTNPKIAQQLIYGLEYGKPENYGPFVASLIQKQATDSSLQQRQEPAN